jgi:hypothetical protein
MKPKPSYHIRRALGVLALAAGLIVHTVQAQGTAQGQVAAASATPAVASASEMLEQGIYNEETKGDLDAAISIYRQLITETRANDSLGAQAEYRLGQCLLKKGQKDEATAAFQKLVTDYPNEKDLVAKAQGYLPSALKMLPAPWVDGERMLLTMSTANGTDLGVVEYRSYLTQAGGQQVWRVGARVEAAGVGSVSSVDADPDTFAPISSRWKHALFGEVTAVYEPGQVELHRQGKDVTTMRVDGPVFDNEEALDAMRRLPLATGYKVTIPVFTILGGAEIPIEVEVKGTEMVQAPAGNFQCWKVQLSVGQTFWFSTDANRYLVQFEAGAVTAKLTSVTQRGPQDPVKFRDAELGVSLTTPPQWVVARLKGGQPTGQALVRTYDPDADATDGGVRYFATNTLTADEQKSSEAWAELDFKKRALGADAKTRPDGWKAYTVAGLPAVGCVTDYTQNGSSRTIFMLYVHAPKNSELFVLASATDKFDGLMAQFQSILSSYQRD